MTPGSSRTRFYWPAAAVALAGALVATLLLVGARDRADRADERDAARAAARAVLPLTAAIEDQRDRAGLATGKGTLLVDSTDPDGPSASVAALARDTGTPVVDDAQGGVVVVARYDPPSPTSTAARRSDLVGYALTPLDLGGTLDRLVPEGGSVTVHGPDHEVYAKGSAASGDVRFSVTLDDATAPGWRLESSAGSSDLPLRAWLISTSALLLGLLGAAVTARRAGRSQRLQEEARRRAQYDAGLAELATIVQGSLDLAEVLPASFALLEERLDLAGLALTGSRAGTTFVWRDAPAPDEPAVPAVAPIAAGICVDIPLARSGRSLGSLRIRPNNDLDDLDLSTLTTAAETISSSIANAEAFEHQRALVARMRKLDDLKTVFVATASHELRTPVAAVVGYANMLTENWADLDSETGLLYAQRVESNAQRLVSLVENLLDFARLEQGRAYSDEKEPLDLGVEVSSLIESQPNLTPHHELEVTAEEGLLVAGSRLAVERVVTNLVGNAVKYSPVGTTIRVRVEGDADTARLVVDDEGPGVPAEEREQIFSRFFRGAGDAVTRTQGAGLGLSIVTEFATFMGGTVRIDAAPSGGTRFEVVYPRYDARALVPAMEQGASDDSS